MKNILFLIILLSQSFQAIGSEMNECRHFRGADFDFLGNGKKQYLRISITGSSSCENALINISVTDNKNKFYYSWSGSLMDRAKWIIERENKNWEKVSQQILEELLTRFTKPTTYLTKYKQDINCGVRFVVSKKYFNSFSKRNIPIYSHPNGLENSRHIAFIPELNQAIVIANEGC